MLHWPDGGSDMGHVLYVDDEPELCRLGEIALMMDGHTVSTAASAGEAMAFCEDPAWQASAILVRLSRSFIGAGIDLAGRIARARPTAAVTAWSGGIRTLPPDLPATVRLRAKPLRVGEFREAARLTGEATRLRPCRSW